MTKDLIKRIDKGKELTKSEVKPSFAKGISQALLRLLVPLNINGFMIKTKKGGKVNERSI